MNYFLNLLLVIFSIKCSISSLDYDDFQPYMVGSDLDKEWDAFKVYYNNLILLNLTVALLYTHLLDYFEFFKQ